MLYVILTTSDPIIELSIWVLHSSLQANVNKLDQKRRLRLEKMDKIFHDLEVVPLFGDMQIAPFNYVKRMKHYDAGKWPLSSQANLVSPQVKS